MMRYAYGGNCTDEVHAEAEGRTLGALTSHPSESGCGVVVSTFWKRGAVNYKKVPVLKGLDLEAFRGPSRLETRVFIS